MVSSPGAMSFFCECCTANGQQPDVRFILINYSRQQMALIIFANTPPLGVEEIRFAEMEAVTANGPHVIGRSALPLRRRTACP